MLNQLQDYELLQQIGTQADFERYQELGRFADQIQGDRMLDLLGNMAGVEASRFQSQLHQQDVAEGVNRRGTAIATMQQNATAANQQGWNKVFGDVAPITF
jgi:hypothetical protein